MGSQQLILLDTHVLVWLVEGVDRIGQKTRQLTDRALQNEQILVAGVSFWEIAMLARKNKVAAIRSCNTWRQAVLAMGLQEIPLDGAIGITSAELPDFHAGLADRMIVATALHHGATLLTAD